MKLPLVAAVLSLALASQQSAPPGRYLDDEGRVRIALANQPFSPTGLSRGPTTMADGGIRKVLTTG